MSLVGISFVFALFVEAGNVVVLVLVLLVAFTSGIAEGGSH